MRRFGDERCKKWGSSDEFSFDLSDEESIRHPGGDCMQLSWMDESETQGLNLDEI